MSFVPLPPGLATNPFESRPEHQAMCAMENQLFGSRFEQARLAPESALLSKAQQNSVMFMAQDKYMLHIKPTSPLVHCKMPPFEGALSANLVYTKYAESSDLESQLFAGKPEKQLKRFERLFYSQRGLRVIRDLLVRREEQMTASLQSVPLLELCVSRTEYREELQRVLSKSALTPQQKLVVFNSEYETDLEDFQALKTHCQTLGKIHPGAIRKLRAMAEDGNEQDKENVARLAKELMGLVEFTPDFQALWEDFQ